MLHFQHQSTGFQEKFVHDDALRFQTATNIAKQAESCSDESWGSPNKKRSRSANLVRATSLIQKMRLTKP